MTITKTFSAALLFGLVGLLSGTAFAGSYTDQLSPERRAVIDKWLDKGFVDSSLSREQQLEELAWFVQAAESFRGKTINVLSETIETHRYESEVLAKAFSDITGINLVHDLKSEGEVINQFWL